MLQVTVDRLLQAPRQDQPRLIEEALAALPPTDPEQWNTRFGPGSLFEAWTQTEMVQGVYAANRPFLAQLPAGFVAVEIGGGDGSLWQGLDHLQGELWLFDPVPEVHDRVREVLPAGIRLHSRIEPVGEDLPAADRVICSLTLHHVAGRDRAERRAHGFEGPGKVEILRGIQTAIGARGGVALLNEADVHCEIDLPRGSPILRDRLIDSYVRRCGAALLAAPDGPFTERWEAILRHWCLEQVRLADAPIAERDVYELDVPRWLEVIERAGLTVAAHGFTDRWGLFHQYVLRS